MLYVCVCIRPDTACFSLFRLTWASHCFVCMDLGARYPPNTACGADTRLPLPYKLMENTNGLDDINSSMGGGVGWERGPYACLTDIKK